MKQFSIIGTERDKQKEFIFTYYPENDTIHFEDYLYASYNRSQLLLMLNSTTEFEVFCIHHGQEACVPVKEFRQQLKNIDKLVGYYSKERVDKLLHLIGAQCGIPDPGDACRTILKTIKEYRKENQ